MSMSIDRMEQMLNITTQYKSRKNMTDEELEEHKRLVYKRNNRRAYLRKKLIKQEEQAKQQGNKVSKAENRRKEVKPHFNILFLFRVLVSLANNTHK